MAKAKLLKKLFLGNPLFGGWGKRRKDHFILLFIFYFFWEIP
jgi:hypothetical protein